MRKLFLIIGGGLCLVLIVAAMYIALTIGLSVYIAYTNQARMLAQKHQMAQTEMQQMQHQIASLGNNMTPDVVENKRKADELAGKLPTLFVDPEDYKTEDNWLATAISREIAEMAFFAANPAAQLPDLKIKAEVDPDKPQVHVEINGFGAGTDATIASDLTPMFAWDPAGYASLARQLLGATPATAPVPNSDENDVLGHLLNLTGATLAAEDVRLSGNLQRHPTSWEDHEGAALVLTALALREQAGAYSDNRTLLNRATAHLALAQALRGDQRATWPGLIADAAIRTLAGRELDALAHLDNLNTQPDLPESAKTWITALRLLAKQDWRVADVTSKSPLLVKIAWFQILRLDLVLDVADKRLEKVVLQPPQDPNVAPDQQKTNPETLIPDWGRIAGRSPFYDESDDDAKNGEYRLDLEFHELDEILKTEGSAPFDLDKLASVYSEEEKDTVSRGADGKTMVRVIGPGGFKATSRRHVLAAMISKSPIPDPAQDPAQIQILFTKFDLLLQGVPGYDFARLHLNFLEPDEYKKQIADWLAAKRTWRVWEVPYGLARGMPGYAHVEAFYHRAVPFGTVYDPGLDGRYSFINAVNPQVFPPFDTPELEKIKKLPIQQANLAIGDYTLKYNAKLQGMGPHGPKPFEQELLKLDPDQYVLTQDHLPNDKLMAATARFLDYNMNPIERIEDLDSDHLSDADRIIVLRKHVEFEPQFSAMLSDLLRKNGRDDEAAEIDRKNLADLTDPDLALSVLLPLVDYDLDHGFYDEVLSLAKKEDLTTEKGQTIYFLLLETSGKLDEAEACGKQLHATFKDEWPLAELYILHRDHFPAQYAAAEKRLFPAGLIKVSLDSFSDKPLTGAVLSEGPDPVRTLNGPKWRMDRAGLQTNEVVVALDGYRVESGPQYSFIKNLSQNPEMDFIVWRDPKFVEIKSIIPKRRLNIPTWSYKPPE